MYISNQRPYHMHQRQLMDESWRAYKKIGAQLRIIEDYLYDFSQKSFSDSEGLEHAEITREMIADQVHFVDQYVRQLTRAANRLLVEISDGPVTDLGIDDNREPDEVAQ